MEKRPNLSERDYEILTAIWELQMKFGVDKEYICKILCKIDNGFTVNRKTPADEMVELLTTTKVVHNEWTGSNFRVRQRSKDGKDPKMIEAGKKSWDTRRKNMAEKGK
jgi:hypothetical protein